MAVGMLMPTFRVAHVARKKATGPARCVHFIWRPVEEA